MPTGVYPRGPRGAHERADNTRHALLRSEIVRLGVAWRAKTLIAELRTLARLYPVVVEIVPAAAALLAKDLVIIEATTGPLPTRAALPLKPKLSKAARARLSTRAKQAWSARRGDDTDPKAEINPKTGKPYTMSKRARRAIARGRRAGLKRAKAKRAKGKRPPMPVSARKLLSIAATRRWKQSKKLGLTHLGPVNVNGARSAEAAASS